jgi:hypothetical protein
MEDKNFLNHILATMYPLIIDQKYVISADLTDYTGKNIILSGDDTMKLKDKRFMSRIDRIALTVDVPLLMRDFVNNYITHIEMEADDDDDASRPTLPE